MSDKPLPLFERVMAWLRFLVAGFAVRFCGPAALFWADATAWEAYLAESQKEVADG